MIEHAADACISAAERTSNSAININNQLHKKVKMRRGVPSLIDTNLNRISKNNNFFIIKFEYIAI